MVAGYTMRKRKFFQNFGTIMMLGVVGSIVTALSISLILYGLQERMPGLCAGNGESKDPLPCMILGTILCNVDLVATLSVMSPTETPQLYSILFGEGVINDAVSIVLFDASLKAAASSGGFADNAMGIIGHFFLLLFGSILLGVLCGLACSFFFKRTRIAKDTKRAVSVFALFAYGSYLIAEVLEMSGIMSVFFCGIAMAHYNWYNLSASARLVTAQTFQSVSYACEMFVFCYMGFSVWTLSFEQTVGNKERSAKWSPALIVTAAFTTWVVRGFVTVVFSGIMNCFRTKQIPAKEQVVIFFSGTMRGCVAFALALKVDEDGKDEDGKELESGVFSTTILAISIFTTLIFGGISAPVLQALGLKNAGGHGQPEGEPAAGEPEARQGAGGGAGAQPALKKLGGARGVGAGLGDPLLDSSPSYEGLRARGGSSGSTPSPLVLESEGSVEVGASAGGEGADEARAGLGAAHPDAIRQAGLLGTKLPNSEGGVGPEGALRIDTGAAANWSGARDDDQLDSAGKKFRHPSMVGHGVAADEMNTQIGVSPDHKKGRFGQLHRIWKRLDEEWLKPWFGGLPRTVTALEKQHALLRQELDEAQEALRRDQEAVATREELVGSLELEIADKARQITLVRCC